MAARCDKQTIGRKGNALEAIPLLPGLVRTNRMWVPLEAGQQLSRGHFPYIASPSDLDGRSQEPAVRREGDSPSRGPIVGELAVELARARIPQPHAVVAAAGQEPATRGER